VHLVDPEALAALVSDRSELVREDSIVIIHMLGRVWLI
jgi:hypothetical protein